MSPLRSSAGPGDLADADAELAADDLRERGLAEPGRAREQDVVERLAARLRRVERDRELLLDALLADEVGERLRAERALELLLAAVVGGGREDARRGHAACRSAARTCSSTGSDSSTSGERALGVDERPAELDERVAREQRAPLARGRRRRQPGAELLLQLEHDPLCRLAADPGDRLEARRVVARRSRGGAPSGVDPETIASATFGPTPETPSSSSNSSRSSAEANP